MTARLSPPSDCGGWVSASRGKRWHATDGSGTIYISDNDNAGAQRFADLSGVVITADGTRYRFSGSRCTSITDRNGNRIDINYTSQPVKVEYKDQLGRITKIEQFVADPDDPEITLAVLVTIPGYSGNRYIKIKRNAMSANYRSDITPPSAVCTGVYDPLSKGYSSWCGSSPTILFPHSYGLFLQRIDNQQVLTEVVLPDHRSLRFKYNLFGEVAEAQLPTGGKLWYDYEYQGAIPTGNSPLWETGGSFHTEVHEIDRALVQRRIFDGATLQATWNYSNAESDVYVLASSPVEGVLRNERHQFLQALRYTDYPGSITGAHDGTYYSRWSTGVEWRTEIRNAAGTDVLRASEKDWDQRALVQWSGGYPQEQPENDNRIKQERSYLETGKMAKVDTLYDQFNNPTEIKEYDFDQTLKRRTVISYLSLNNNIDYQIDDGVHLLGLPVTQTIYDGIGNKKSQSVTEYDNYISGDGNHGDLTNYCPPPNCTVSQHDSTYDPAKKTRGNPTRIDTWVNTTDSFISSYPRYDVLGNVVSVKDPRGNESTISFVDDFGNGSNPGTPSQNPTTPTYALPTLVTSPPPVPGALAQTVRSQYDYATGLVTGLRDPNNVVTQTIYDDPFNRPTKVIAALGIAGVESRTLMYYAPVLTPFGITLSNNDVLTAKDQTVLGDGNLRSWTVTDSFGRTKETWTRDPQGDVKVETSYDGLGREKQTSNPFRLGETAAYTTTTYDLLGRVITVKTPDNAVVSTTFDGDSTTVTDPAGKARKSVNDGLGRLIKVVEDPTPGVNYETTYEYDALDNLVKVIQGSQQRFFMYDSLKRLLRSRNPEQGTHQNLALTDPVTGNSAWSTGYQYDAAGNLTRKTDARGVDCTYVYDALNRNTTLDYSDTSLSPDVKRFYDGATRGIGRFWYAFKGDESAANDVEKTSVDEYDPLGRPLTQQQSFKLNDVWKPYPVRRTYNLAGAVLTQTYPSTRTVSYSYDVAGRTASFSGNLGGDPRTYATGITYSAWGSLSREQFGTDAALYHKTFYNIRGQLFDTRLSSVDDTWDWNLGRLILYYSSNHLWGQSGTDNNGNVRFAETWIPPENATLDQRDTLFEDAYTYDSLNRLVSVVDQRKSEATGWENWQEQFRQTYDYDRYGNRTINTDPAQTSGTGINNKAFEKETATNRLYSPGDLALPDNQRRIRYDDAGNQTKDTYTGYGTATFDADNHIATIQDKNGGTTNYTYNADGRRTRRKIGNQETWQIYGMDGELLAEYAAGSSTNTPQKEYGYRNGQLLVTASPGNGPNSLSVNGSTAYVEVPNSSSLNIAGPITMEAWIKLPSVPTSYQPILDHSPSLGNQGGYDMYVTDTGKARMDIFYGPSYQWLIGATTLSANVWHHIAGVYDGSQLRLYVDGQLDGSVNLSSPMTGTAVQLRIGRNNYLYTPIYFNGLIDEVRISTGALYSSNFTPATSLTASGSTKGLWKFDGQTVSDSSANGNNGTLNGGTYSTDVPTGPSTSYYSGSFNGGGAYVEVPNSSSLNIAGPITMEAWIKLPSVPTSYQPILDHSPSLGNQGGYDMYVTDTGKARMDIFYGPSYQWLIGATTLSANVWHHIAGVYDGSQLRLYVDGQLDGSVNLSSPMTGTAVQLRIGRNNYLYTPIYFNGLIDEVRISTAALYSSNFTPQTHLTASGSTKGLWKFDGQTTNDSSGNGNNGTLQGATYSADVPSGDGGGGGSSTSTAAQVQWLVSDHLGTPRMIVDQRGTLASVKRHDYLPFGEEIFANVGGRTTGLGYGGGDGVRQQFTQKERDVETGLDYFLARYYSSIQGRFTSTDEFNGGAYEFWLLGDPSAGEKQALPFGDIRFPQSLNKYQYCYNNPLKFIDPNGHDALYMENKDTGKTTVVIPVHFTGPSATQNLISEVISRASQLDTGNPNVTIQIVATDTPMNGVLNTMHLSPELDPKYPKGEGAEKGGKKGHIRSNGVGSGGAIVHDTLHFAGLKDRYKEKWSMSMKRRATKPTEGYDNSNIMVNSGGTTLKPEQIQEAKNNSSTKKCTTENGVTKCQ